jgi:argininosuccinate lyase
MKLAAARGYSTATDLADWLVQNLNMPFRQAHGATGRIVKIAEARDCRLDELTLAELQSVEPRITSAIFKVLSVENSVASRTSFGGTAPDNVRRMAKDARKRL